MGFLLSLSLPNTMLLVFAVLEVGLLCAMSYAFGEYRKHRNHKSIVARNSTLTRLTLAVLATNVLISAICLVVFAFVDVSKLTVQLYSVLLDSLRLVTVTVNCVRAFALFWNLQFMYAQVDEIWRTQLGGSSPNLNATASFYLAHNGLFSQTMRILRVSLFVIVPVIIFVMDGIPLLLNAKGHGLVVKLIHLFVLVCVMAVIALMVHKISHVADTYQIGEEIHHLNLSVCGIWAVALLTEVVLVAIQSTVDNKMHTVDIIVSSAGLCIGSAVAFYFATLWVVSKVKLKHMESKVNVEEEEVNADDLLSLNEVLSIKKGFEVFAHFLVREFALENLLFLVEVKQFKGCVRQKHAQLQEFAQRESEKARDHFSFKRGMSNDSDCESPLLEALSTHPRIKSIDLLQAAVIPEDVATDDADIAGVKNLGLTLEKRSGSDCSSTSHLDVDFSALKSTTTTRASPAIFQSEKTLGVEWVPHCEAVQDTDDIFVQANNIFLKFVVDSAQLQVNLGGRGQRLIKAYFNTHTSESVAEAASKALNELFELYDDAWTAIWSLVDGDSFFRFKTTQEYWELCKNHKEEIKRVMHKRKESGASSPMIGDFIRGVAVHMDHFKAHILHKDEDHVAEIEVVEIEVADTNIAEDVEQD